MAKLTKTEKFLNLLSSGKEFTAEKIAKRTGLVNVSSTVHRLREEGIDIYTNARRDRDGYRYYAYRMAA